MTGRDVSMNPSDVSFQEAKVTPREVESLGHWVNQKQSWDQNSFSWCSEKGITHILTFWGACQEKSVPRIEIRPVEAFGKSFESTQHPGERLTGGDSSHVPPVLFAGVSRGTVWSWWPLIPLVWFSSSPGGGSANYSQLAMLGAINRARDTCLVISRHLSRCLQRLLPLGWAEEAPRSFELCSWFTG